MLEICAANRLPRMVRLIMFADTGLAAIEQNE
jgi:hypothetical protein